MISTDSDHLSASRDPIRVQAFGLDPVVAAQVDEILAGTGSGPATHQLRRNVRFAPRARAADVVLVRAPERAADLGDLAGTIGDGHIIVIVDEANPAVARRLLEAGADGVVAVDELPTTLVPAIAAVAADLVCVPGSAREAALVPALSIRERQVLALMAGGLSNAEIGERLYLSESTIKSHAVSAFRRLGVHTRREAVALVLGSSEALRRSVLMSHPPEGDDRRRGGGQ